MARIVYIVTQPITARYLLNGQLAFLQEKGIELFLITSPGEDLDVAVKREGVSVYPVPMQREIHPLADLISLIRLFRVLQRLKPQIVNAGTPKAGLLGMIAALLAGVPIRIYMLRGLRLETKSGWQKFVLIQTERIASLCAHHVICVSSSLVQKAIRFRLVDPSKLRVLGKGSSNGVDVERFATPPPNTKKLMLEQLGIPEQAPVIGFVGRITKDKGVKELVEIFDRLLSSFPNLHLLVLGDFEQGDPVDPNVQQRLKSFRQIIRPGFVFDTSHYYQLMDVLVFPSHREGFPNAPLEAAAVGVPTVGFAVTGVVDAVDNGISGILVPPFDVTEMVHAISQYLSDPSLRQSHGQAARNRVFQWFQQKEVWERLYQFYSSVLTDSMPAKV
ncbi:glycosyltransferase family 4 protein [bacterium]|nr:glycosyltransferase family 4 protein [bacterium]MCI0606479.1 glycosyltransferase family 4 protein [bacterium]